MIKLFKVGQWDKKGMIGSRYDLDPSSHLLRAHTSLWIGGGEKKSERDLPPATADVVSIHYFITRNCAE